MRWLGIFLSFCFVGASQAQDYTPLAARVVVKHYKVTEGKKHLVEESVGVLYRARDGSVYERTLQVVGPNKSPSDTVSLYDGTSGAIYRMFPATRTATVQKRPTSRPRARTTTPPPDQPVEIVSGQRCTKSAREFPDGQRFIVWFAVDLQGLMIKMESYRPGYEMVKTLEEIKTDTEPDPSFFQVPKDYAVSPGKPR